MSAVVSEEVWRAKGIELFGEDQAGWRFVCPACGREASIATTRAEMTVDQLAALRRGKWAIEQECIGRHLRGIGCDWAAYGLFSGPMFVERGGRAQPVFDVAGEPFTGKAGK